MKKNILGPLLRIIDICLIPLVLIGSVILKIVRRVGVHRMPISRALLCIVGVFPIRDHYFEPLFNASYLKKSLREDRELKGINFNIEEQLAVLNRFHFNMELKKMSINRRNQYEYYYRNGIFESGDAEYLYNIIRSYRPKRIIEIGSGYSTLMAINALKENRHEDNDYSCEHICIEPYENRWLENLGVKVIREIVENVSQELFMQLEANDILFIDSSHMIRPQGDVLYEYLEILPLLKSGVLVHIHDIFSPKDYPDEWIIKEVKFWNEQYLLEAFLSHNRDFKIIGALNFLRHHYPDELTAACPILKNELDIREPGSFWIMRI